MPTETRVRTSTSAKDPLDQFFASLAQPGHIATFEGESATVRFDVQDGVEIDRWHLAVTKGDVAVSRQNRSADAVVHVDRPDLEAIVAGRRNAQAAMLRGLVTLEGDMSALMMFQRCLPGPPGSKGRVAPISSASVMARRRPT